MTSPDPLQQVLNLSPPEILAKDMLVSGSREEKPNPNLVHLSRTLGLSAILRLEACFPKRRNRSPLFLHGRSLRICKMPGTQIVEPILLGDGSILATIEPGGRLVLIREGWDFPVPVRVAPFAVRAKAIREGVCHLLEREGSRICMLDEKLRLVGVSDVLIRAGVERPTSFCFYGDFIGLLSWHRKEAWILDSEWRPVARERLPWVDFLCRPVGVGDALIAVDTPSTSHGPGGLVCVTRDGDSFSLFDPLDAPLGLAACGDLLACGHGEGLTLFRLSGKRAVPLGDIQVRSLCGPLKDYERIALTYILGHGDSFLLFCDVLVAGVSGPGVSRVIEIRVEDALAFLGNSGRGRAEWTAV